MNSNTGERLAATGLALSISLGALTGVAQEAEAATKATPADILVLQQDLNGDLTQLGMPKLAVDGKLGPQTRRALCAERLFTGRLASLADPSKEEIQQLKIQDKLTYKASGIIISKTCQVLGVSGAGITDIMPISTGDTTAGKITPTVNTSVSFARTGWHNSTLYPTETGNGNMYRPLYLAIGGGYAIHGSRAMTPSVTKPLSNGCIRTTQTGQDKLWKLVNGPTTSVQDKVVSVKRVPVRILN